MEKWLNKKAKYTITGISGICTAVASYITGERKLMIEFNDNSGRPCEHWIDERHAEEVTDI